MSSEPRATVLIPTYGRPVHLREALHSLAEQWDEAAPFAVVVVDDGSDPPARLADELPYPAELIRLCTNKGRAAARNAGLAAVNTPVTIFLDDDMRAQEGFVAAHLDAISPEERRVALGKVEFSAAVPKTALTWYLQTRGIVKLQPGEPIPFKYFLTYNSSAPTDLLRDVGGFDGELRAWGGEDLELGYRLSKAGAEFVRAPDALAHHAHHRTIKALWRVSEQFAAEGMPRILARHPELVRELQADVLGPGSYAEGIGIARRVRRLGVRAATSWPLPEVMRELAACVPKAPWPDAVFDYLIASAWRRGLDRGGT